MHAWAAQRTDSKRDDKVGHSGTAPWSQNSPRAGRSDRDTGRVPAMRPVADSLFSPSPQIASATTETTKTEAVDTCTGWQPPARSPLQVRRARHGLQAPKNLGTSDN